MTNDLGEVVITAPIDDGLSTVFDGIRFLFDNDPVRIDTARTGFVEPAGLLDITRQVINIDQPSPQRWMFQGTAVPYDYEIRFSDDLVGQSLGGFQLGTGSAAPTAVSTQTNFTVYNTTLDRPSPFVFFEPSVARRNGRFDAYEFLFIYEDIDNDPATAAVPTYLFRPRTTTITGEFPGAGDVYLLANLKPFSPRDTYTFSTVAAGVDAESAESQLDRIRVVPNPYVAAASWERPLPPTITSGRGERRVDFIHLPGARASASSTSAAPSSGKACTTAGSTTGRSAGTSARAKISRSPTASTSTTSRHRMSAPRPASSPSSSSDAFRVPDEGRHLKRPTP